MLHLVAGRGTGILLQQQPLLFVNLLAHRLAELLLGFEGRQCKPLRLGIGLRNKNVAPDPGVFDTFRNRGFVVSGFTHGLAVKIHAVPGDFVALDVHQERPPFARHAEHGLFA